MSLKNDGNWNTGTHRRTPYKHTETKRHVGKTSQENEHRDEVCTFTTEELPGLLAGWQPPEEAGRALPWRFQGDLGLLAPRYRNPDL